jgi:putative SOS response-associated peptidase YedK
MCARYSLFATPEDIQSLFELQTVPELAPKFNIAPTSQVLFVRKEEAGRSASFARWGLVPSWAKDESIGVRMINARSETLLEKPAFRSAAKRRRCLIPASGFYEWTEVEGKKQPFLITSVTGDLLAFAGLWEEWSSPDGDLTTCTIITCEANGKISDLHDRMPVILSQEDFETWLDSDAHTAPEAAELLVPYPDDLLTTVAVDPRIGNVRFQERPEPVATYKQQGLFG